MTQLFQIPFYGDKTSLSYQRSLVRMRAKYYQLSFWGQVLPYLKKDKAPCSEEPIGETDFSSRESKPHDEIRITNKVVIGSTFREAWTLKRRFTMTAFSLYRRRLASG